jgi:hypothetical protein
MYRTSGKHETVSMTGLILHHTKLVHLEYEMQFCGATCLRFNLQLRSWHCWFIHGKLSMLLVFILQHPRKKADLGIDLICCFISESKFM